MSDSRDQAVAALERWRRFQEARAALNHRNARHGAQVAALAHDRARDSALVAGQQRTGFPGSDRIDLARWQAAAAIEDELWRAVDEYERELVEANALVAAAMEEHLQAHALVEVAAQRGQRLRVEAAAISEKTEFERLAELRGAHQETAP